MIVVDTNIIAYLLLPTTYTHNAEKLYQTDPDWAAPMLWRSEFRNVLALYLRKKIITLEKALQLQDIAETTIIQNEFEPVSSQILALVNESQCSSYDCEFIALAHHLNTKLVTEDKKILKAFPSSATSIDQFLVRQPGQV